MQDRLIRLLGRVTDEERLILEDRKVDRSVYTDRGDFTVDAAKMLERGKLIALRPHTRFIDFPRHSHNYIEIMYTCRGSVTHVINGESVAEVRQGELLFLSCNAYHEIRRADMEDIAVNFIVLPQFFDTAYDMMKGDNILSRFLTENLCGAGGRISHLHFHVADLLPVQNLVENMVCDMTGDTPNLQNISRITMGLLFLQLLGHTERLEPHSHPDHDSRLVIAALREVEENYPDASLTQLACQLNQSVFVLSRLIRQATGRTFIQLLQQKRFSRAAQLLETSRLSVADISAAIGYDNTSYFHRKFLELYGMSPARYRETHFRK